MASDNVPSNVQAAAQPAVVPVPSGTPPPLFRRIDWLAFALTAGLVWLVYLLTLAPELTLEDSGELVTGSVWAGIPHPPGYPVWTIYSWLWTVLLPVGNMAWRVAVGEALAAAVGCGLLAFMVSRGSSMFLEGIQALQQMTGKWENAICLVSGLVAGLLVGLDGFMWKESVVVNRIALFSVPWFMLMLVCLLRWIYAPHQLRYAYWAAFIFGVCFTTHQSLIVAALGFEVAIAAGNPRLGRDAFLGNFLLYLLYILNLQVTGQHLFPNIGARPGLYFLFNAVGLGSLVASAWLAFRTKGLANHWKPILTMALLWCLGVSFYLYMPISGMTNPPMQWGYPRTVDGFFRALSRGQYEQPNPTNILADPTRFLSQLWMLVTGLAEEFTWVYLFVALVPFVLFRNMQRRERAWLIALSAMYVCLGVLLIVLLNPGTDRASADLIKVFLTSSHTVVACLIGYGLALIAAFMATHYQRFRFWGIAGGTVAVALAVLCLWAAAGKHYFGPAGRINLLELPLWISRAFGKDQYGLAIFGNLVPVGIALGFVVALLLYRRRAPLLVTLGLFTAMPLYSGLSHWFSSEQRGHWFGYWFGHDMFTPPFKDAQGRPLYPEMPRNAVLFGGTDPGRFCPTYMIFCESFTPHHDQPTLDQTFDRRDVYIITQNALADGTYLNYIRAQYNRSRQIDPPFFRELFRTVLRDNESRTNLLARAVTPLDRFFTSLGARVEKRRRTGTSCFQEVDLIDVAGLASKLRPSPEQDALSKFIFAQLTRETQQLLQVKAESESLRRRLAQDLNRLLEREFAAGRELAARSVEKATLDDELNSGKLSATKLQRRVRLEKEIAELTKEEPLYTPKRFKGVGLTEYLTDFVQQDPQGPTRIRLNRLLLEAAYPKEIAKSLGGVYPDREIYIASNQDCQRCMDEYMSDVHRRWQHDAQFPQEPRQLRPGEDVRVVNGHVQLSGTIAVMNINALVAKVIFDQNPKNEFFVEESYPLEWMYPHLTPYGIIMKVNRQPPASLSEEVLQTDHRFWKEYAKRLTGDFIDYDTPVKQITDWIEQVYLRRNFAGFTGDRKFVRDNDAQKAFSKLRSAIGGVYAWRLSPQCPPEFRPKTEADLQRLLKEAEFALRQAFAFCPYSPEAVFRYASLLSQLNRVDDALLVAETCLKLDPYNSSIERLLQDLRAMKRSPRQGAEPTRLTLQQMEQTLRQEPTNYQLALDLSGVYLELQQTNRAVQLLDSLLEASSGNPNLALAVAQGYARLHDLPRLELALEKLVKVAPESPEAWYDLAAFKAVLGKPTQALPALRQALELSAKRLAREPNARNLLVQARQDPRLAPLRQSPEFQALVPPK